MTITLDEALALPKANYLEPQAAGLDKDEMISADMDAVVVTNPTSLQPYPHTDSFTACLCVMVENLENGTMMLGHLVSYRKEALQQLLSDIRRSPGDRVHVHMIGAMYDDYEYPEDNPQLEQEWREEMQGLIDVINAHDKVELVTFDVGTRPHPTEVVFYRDNEGKTQIVRGSVDVCSNTELENVSLPHRSKYDRYFRKIDMPPLPKGFKVSAEIPYAVTYDGRLPDNQDFDRNPEAFRAMQEKDPTWRR